MTLDEAALELDGELDRILRGELAGTRPDRRGSDLDGLVATARLLHAVLPRFHPRFGFEEALAARLGRGPGSDPDAPIPLPVAAVGESALDARRVWERYRRELVAGGAIASGVSIALPLAGAAFVRWRRSRSSGSGIL